MLASIACLALAVSSPDILVIDGMATAEIRDGVWTRPRPLAPTLKLPMTEVGRSSNLGGARVVELHRTPDRLAWFTSHRIEGAWFSGKAWSPRNVTIPLNRSRIWNWIARGAKQANWIGTPYLSGVWQVDIEGDGIEEFVVEARSNVTSATGWAWSTVLVLKGAFDVQWIMQSKSGPPCLVRSISDLDGNGTFEVVAGRLGPTIRVDRVWTFVRGEPTFLIDSTYEIATNLFGEFE